jgi:hypothetical protein
LSRRKEDHGSALTNRVATLNREEDGEGEGDFLDTPAAERKRWGDGLDTPATSRPKRARSSASSTKGVTLTLRDQEKVWFSHFFELNSVIYTFF